MLLKSLFKNKIKKSHLAMLEDMLQDNTIKFEKKIDCLEQNIFRKIDNVILLGNELEHIKKSLQVFKSEIQKDIKSLDWKLKLINKDINIIFQYFSGIELNHDFIMEREILFDPARAPIDHYNRYKFAVENISKDDFVADIASACGYGTSMLGKKAKQVLGIDISMPVINFANKVYATDNVSFICQDAQNLELDKRFDSIVSFETIEHIPYPELFLNKIYKLLKQEGKIICSVPNEEVCPYEKSSNRFHYRHYTKDELIDLLNKCGFDIEKICYQDWNNNFEVIDTPTDKSKTNVLIAIARKK